MARGNTKPPKRNVWTTVEFMRSNLKLAKQLCPENNIFKYWFGQWIREKLTEDLEKMKRESATS